MNWQEFWGWLAVAYCVGLVLFMRWLDRHA